MPGACRAGGWWRRRWRRLSLGFSARRRRFHGRIQCNPGDLEYRASGPIVAPRSAPTRPVREDLGTDTIAGVEARGTRLTTTIPAGRIGNDQPLVRTAERWWAPSLGGLTLRDITDDPQSGKSTRQLVSLDLSEPDPSTFQPPEGYEVVTEEMRQVACQQMQ
jgi:hypothetical protein